MLEIERRISPHKRTRNFIHGNAEVSRLEFEISEAKFPMSVMDIGQRESYDRRTRKFITVF